MNKTFKIRVAGIFIMLAMLALFSLAVMLLWNALLPGILGVSALNYGQAAGLLLLSRILFGGLGGFGGRGFVMHGGRDGRLFHHGNPLREKWMSMTEEERKAFIKKEKDFAHFHRGFSHFHDFFGEDVPSREGGAKADIGRKDAPGNTGDEGKNHE
ncbi:MAG: hypothetical protein LBK61_03085 [Spirochaetaceae bacterium]|jgi:hypothetical protein|nr:hypothetical protein [Spirochaetaceae bacterium]